MLAGVMLDGPAARLAGMLDPAFLAEAGWDPASRVLSLPASHPLLGRTLCRADGCPATAQGTKTGWLCQSCFARLRRAGMSAEQIGALPRVPTAPPRPAGCLVPGCERMSPGGRQGQRTGLCGAHSRQFRRTAGMTIERFLADPAVRPLTAMGPCGVAACSRRAESGRGYCRAHDLRWRVTVTAAPGTGQRHWELTEPAVSESGQVSLRGLAPLVAVQVLFGIWQRTRSGAKITDVNLRGVCDTLRRRQSASIADCPPAAVRPGGRPGRCWPPWPATSAAAWPIPPPSRTATSGTWPSSATRAGCRSPASASRGWPAQRRPGPRASCPATAAAGPARSRPRSTRLPGCPEACGPAAITG